MQSHPPFDIARPVQLVEDESVPTGLFERFPTLTPEIFLFVVGMWNLLISLVFTHRAVPEGHARARARVKAFLRWTTTENGLPFVALEEGESALQVHLIVVSFPTTNGGCGRGTGGRSGVL